METLGAVAASVQLGTFAITGIWKMFQLSNNLADMPGRLAEILLYLDREVTSINGLFLDTPPVLSHLTLRKQFTIHEDMRSIRKEFLADHEVQRQHMSALNKSLVYVKECSEKSVCGSEENTLSLDRMQSRLLDSQQEIYSQMRIDSKNIEQALHTYVSEHHEQFIGNRAALIQEIATGLSDYTPHEVQKHPAQPSGDVDMLLEIDTKRHMARLSTSRYQLTSVLKTTEMLAALRHHTRWRCTCKKPPAETFWRLGANRFQFFTGRITNCILHGKRTIWGCSVETELSPMANGILQLSLGLMSGKKGWEMTRSLRYRGILLRAHNPILKQFDRFYEALPVTQHPASTPQSRLPTRSSQHNKSILITIIDSHLAISYCLLHAMTESLKKVHGCVGVFTNEYWPPHGIRNQWVQLPRRIISDDFEDVVKIHAALCFIRALSWKQSIMSWKRHRLVARPRKTLVGVLRWAKPTK
ncbi:hypothetical protein HJFPF1_08513 [Paramyrothecium foliicola]|nr:hypothetical protein HJFPF1_08513 [Paramyrothecium foliicola]